MPCFLVIFALVTPRLLVALLWFSTRWFEGMFSSQLWLTVGFIFLPTTLLWYTAVQHWFGGQWTLGPVLGVVVALAIDLSPAGGYRRRRA
jgi:hypothetical protein